MNCHCLNSKSGKTLRAAPTLPFNIRSLPDLTRPQSSPMIHIQDQEPQETNDIARQGMRTH